MSIEERHRAILAIIASNGSITTDRIQKDFGVSYDSAKRDLRLLEERGLLKRTHGGAIPVSDDLFAPRTRPTENTDDISRLADHAASLVADGETIFLMGGEIGLAIIERLSAKDLCVVTNSLQNAVSLRSRPIMSILIGGSISSGGDFCDSLSLMMVKRMRFDKCFLMTDGISADFGISSRDPAMAAFLSEVVEGAGKVIGIFQSELVGREAAFSVCKADRLSCLITDGGDRLADFSKLGVRVVKL